MNPTVLNLLLAFLIVDAAALLFLLSFRLYRALRRGKIRHFGDRAEALVEEYIRKHFPDATLFHNVFLKTERGVTQVDHILLCKWGIWVIETKSHNGTIRIGHREWIQIWGDKVVRFHSPLAQNRLHQRALRQALQESRVKVPVPIQGVVVFTSKKVRISKREKGVVYLSELARFIKSGGKTVSAKRAYTASAKGRYLNRRDIAALKRAVQEQAVRSPLSRRKHERWVRRLDRNR